jgi:hypothetical protein
MFRRFFASMVAGFVIVSVAAVPHASAAYKGTGFDANDRARGTNCCYVDPDFRSSTRKVRVDEKGRSWLTITFRTYDWLAGGP